MDEVVGQSRLMAPAGESVRLPVGHMVCNQTPPVGDQPSLMTFRVRALPLSTAARSHHGAGRCACWLPIANSMMGHSSTGARSLPTLFVIRWPLCHEQALPWL